MDNDFTPETQPDLTGDDDSFNTDLANLIIECCDERGAVLGIDGNEIFDQFFGWFMEN